MGPAATGERVYINCGSPVEGRYVTVVKNTQGRRERLTLCEVFVFGYIGKMIFVASYVVVFLSLTFSV